MALAEETGIRSLYRVPKYVRTSIEGPVQSVEKTGGGDVGHLRLLEYSVDLPYIEGYLV